MDSFESATEYVTLLPLSESSAVDVPDASSDEPHPVNRPTIKTMVPATAPSFREFILCWPSVHFCAKNSSARPENLPNALKKDVLLYADDYNLFFPHGIQTVSLFSIFRFLYASFLQASAREGSIGGRSRRRLYLVRRNRQKTRRLFHADGRSRYDVFQDITCSRTER